MLKEICQREVLEEQAIELKRRNFRPGFDNMDAKAALLWLQLNYDRFTYSILHNKYSPMPALGFQIAKLSGGYRSLSRLRQYRTIRRERVLRKVAF